ncbi:His-Xaa-Ser system radical SAM maturase HxsB [Roseateles chitinivorans]|uniref:His-Xaa-Ser system radical SAM maturase HxsB n=1 Tax=Roseateles chitinivorans TaxID=2917965 RepID=UPI003D66BBE1
MRRVDESTSACLSPVGEVAFIKIRELALLRREPSALSPETIRELKSRLILKSGSATPGQDRLYASRIASKRATASSGPELHIIVPTLQCAHSCQYCQVSRALDSQGFSLSAEQVLAACDLVMQSMAPVLTVEFQGGDPLNRFDLVELAIEALAHHPERRNRPIRFVVASTLHQLTEDMCRYFAQYDVKLSTSVDGPAWLHNKNRPLPTRDSYERTVTGIALARSVLGADSVSALMTTTKLSLEHPEVIVDEYVALGLHEIFLRPLSHYGFAKRNLQMLGYTVEQFMTFYRRALNRVIWWNEQGFSMREVYASLILNKLISSFDAGYVDLQSPNASGRAVLVYNYDGHVYPSDEARMLAESGDISFRMGKIGTPMETLLESPAARRIHLEGAVENDDNCSSCSFRSHCAPSPVDAAASGVATFTIPTSETEHCKRTTALFDEMLKRLAAARARDPNLEKLLQRWSAPAGAGV